jgi:hypothetical protein
MLLKKLLFPTSRLIPDTQESPHCANASEKPQTNNCGGLKYHNETQRTSQKAARETKHSYNPTKANGYVAKNGNDIDDVLLCRNKTATSETRDLYRNLE